VLTWDPRGFGKSTGTITTDYAGAEGCDVQRIMDWLATRPDVRLDAKTDPRVGMVGGSYGGGIQLVTAAIDCRIDAIVPTIAWHSLDTSLYKAQIVKAGWSNILYNAAAGRDLDPHITSAYRSGQATGSISAADRAWFVSRGPGPLIAKITAPTLFIQGTVDTLFTLDEAVTNYGILRRRGVPTAMLWYCGGHGACLTDGGDPAATGDATNAWLRRWLRPDPSVEDATDRMWLRFVDGRPVSSVTIDYLDWCCRKLHADGKEALFLVWDNAPWHVSQQVRAWIRGHNRQVKQDRDGVRIIACYLPIKSPWLNAIEATWVHGKRRVLEADGLLTIQELADRVSDAYACPHEPHLVIPAKAA